MLRILLTIFKFPISFNHETSHISVLKYQKISLQKKPGFKWLIRLNSVFVFRRQHNRKINNFFWTNWVTIEKAPFTFNTLITHPKITRFFHNFPTQHLRFCCCRCFFLYLNLYGKIPTKITIPCYFLL